MSSNIVLSKGVPGLMDAWTLSRALIMITHLSHEIDASGIKLKTEVGFGNPTDNMLRINYPSIKLFCNHQHFFTSTSADKICELAKAEERDLSTIYLKIQFDKLKKIVPDLINENRAKRTVEIIIETNILINEKIPVNKNYCYHIMRQEI